MTGWRVKKEVSTVEQIQCSLCSISQIFIEQTPKMKIEGLMRMYPSTEWFGYLVGYKSEKGNIFVTDLVIPPHAYVPTMGSAEADTPTYNPETGEYTFHNPKDTVGCIHSHDSLGAFHSGTDHNYVDQNYPISITVAKRPGSNELEFDAVCYAETPCKKTFMSKTQVKYLIPSVPKEIEIWLGEAKKNIEPEKKKINLNLKEFKNKLEYRLSKKEKGKLRKRDKEMIQALSDSQGTLPVQFLDENGFALSQKELEDILNRDKDIA